LQEDEDFSKKYDRNMCQKWSDAHPRWSDINPIWYDTNRCWLLISRRRVSLSWSASCHIKFLNAELISILQMGKDSDVLGEKDEVGVQYHEVISWFKGHKNKFYHRSTSFLRLPLKTLDRLTDIIHTVCIEIHTQLNCIVAEDVCIWHVCVTLLQLATCWIKTNGQYNTMESFVEMD
jgi:hypothetical protein